MIHFLNVVLALFNMIFSYLVWESLPDRFPMHFNACGAADRWLASSLCNWYVLPLSGLVMTALLYASRYAKINPERWNVFKKGEFVGFPAEKREKFIASAKTILTGMCYQMAAVMNILLVFIQVVIYMLSMNIITRAPVYAMFVTPVIVIVIMVNIVVKMKALLNEIRGD